jgi:hypothetical protein
MTKKREKKNQKKKNFDDGVFKDSFSTQDYCLGFNMFFLQNKGYRNGKIEI